MNALEKILVPTDFSESAEAGIGYAVSLAERLSAEVHVVHAFELPLYGFPDGNLAITAEMASKLIEISERELAEVKKRYMARNVVITTHLEQCEPREGILRAARRIGANLIVMGTHGRRGLARVLIGSTAEYIVRTSPIPVVTVHRPETKEVAA